MSLPSNVEPSTPKLARYVVRSSDVLEDLKVNVMLENSDKVVWFKERFLEEEEIVEHFVHNESRRIQWTMHRPRNGWYIRIRSPAFPPGAFIPLIPPLPNSSHPPGALLFSSRTNIPPVVDALARVSTSTVHSYPPTPPPAVVVHPPTPASIQTRLEQAQGSQRPQPPPTQVTDFVLAPYVGEPVQPAQMWFFQRAYSMIRSSTAALSYSFTLSRVGMPPSSPSDAAASPLPSPADSTVSLAAPVALPPLLTFHDRTPVMMVSTVTGLIEVDQAEERLLGVDSSFWIAVALTYLEFLQEKESYLAALSD
ncbi:hypothetical protein MSAN_00663300 [Mycena sanguinolenta]|uniref:Uncharacterized protein n=1 Tax=Mycena sanguinolenta TaxID=230812 RepID=A0A8H6Z3J6_9AGAR|nr:hypothetical protein MSAN_00663300 [Mycena sanguinolenta]